MNKVIIECYELIDEYRLNEENILKQLESIKIEKGAKNFVIAYYNDSHYTLIGEIKDNRVVLTNVEKAIKFIKIDNSDIFEFIRRQSY
ncbi:MAG: hypothetical protein GX194_08445 [Clostridium sp.]|nr:hypothetical protein [Clostridium sp.]